MAGYLVFGIVMLAAVVVFVFLWRRRKSKRAQALGDAILSQPSADDPDILDLL